MAHRRFRFQRAVQDDNKFPRSAALEALAEKWPDEKTRKLLEERAVEETEDWVKELAKRLLGELAGKLR